MYRLKCGRASKWPSEGAAPTVAGMGHWMDTVLPVVSSSLGALLGGLGASWYGTRAAMRKFQHERAFDARVTWHRELAETAMVLRNRSRGLRYARHREMPPELVVPELQKLGELMFRFQELAEQAPLYAKRETSKSLGEVIHEMNGLRSSFENPPPLSDDPDAPPHPYDLSMSALELIFLMLARDMREMLNLGDLPEFETLERIEKKVADARQ